MAVTLIANRFRCTECNRVVFTAAPEHCCGYTMLVERDSARK